MWAQPIPPAQFNDLQAAIHWDVVHIGTNTQSSLWQEEKKVLSPYSQEELIRALLAEVDVDTRSLGEQYDRSVSIRAIYQALDLPPVAICQELDQAQTIYRKVVLIRMLECINTPEVTASLLRQLKDRRPALDYGKFNGEGARMHPLRVCDVACNVVSNNLVPDYGGDRIGATWSDRHRDKAMRQMLKDLGLSMPR